jgi:hypothetical protein
MASRLTWIGATLAGLLAVNLLLYTIGRATGGTFTYTQSGKPVRVDAVAVALLSLAPLASGLLLVAVIGRRWATVVPVAKVAAVVVAVATIAVMTIPADFDRRSTAFLALMHLAAIPAALLTIGRCGATAPAEARSVQQEQFR